MSNNNSGGISKFWIICIVLAVLYIMGSVSDKNNNSSNYHTDFTPTENYKNLGCSYPGCVNGKGKNPTYCDWHTEHH